MSRNIRSITVSKNAQSAKKKGVHATAIIKKLRRHRSKTNTLRIRYLYYVATKR